MAFNPANLTLVIPDSGPGSAVASYSTADTFSTTLGNGYFDAAFLRIGDALLIAASDATWLCQVTSSDTSSGVGIFNAIHL